jgi:hypothetical protein
MIFEINLSNPNSLRPTLLLMIFEINLSNPNSLRTTLLLMIFEIKYTKISYMRAKFIHRILVYPGFSLVGRHCRVIGFYHHFQICHYYQTYLGEDSTDSYYKLICQTSFHVRCLKTLSL